MRFVFGVLAYNEADLIVETLESIKFQVLNYGREYQSCLYVMDDCSQDTTVEVCEEWIAENRMFFSECKVIRNKENKGTVHNYNYLLELIGDDRFKIIAGDDLLSSQNYYELCSKVDENTISTCIKLILRNGCLEYDLRYLKSFFYCMKKKGTKKYYLQQMRRGCFLHTPSTIYTKRLYDKAHCRELNSRFRLFEDDPAWYSMIKNVDDLNIKFEEAIIVLYRVHDRAVSNGKKKGKEKTLFEQELKKLGQIYLADAKGIEKIYLHARHTFDLPKIFRLDLYVDKCIQWYRGCVVSKDSEFIKFKDRIDKMVDDEQKYYNTLIKEIDT